RFDDDILEVQVYVDDIIFGSTNPRYSTLFSDLMKSRFEMSMMGEMMFFFGLQGTVNMGLWYTKDSGFELTGFSDADYAGCKDTFKSTSGGAQFLGEKLMSWSLKKQDYKLDLDQIGTPVDATKYRSMISALMYLTSSRPDIAHATCDSGFELTGFPDADYAGCKDTFKSTSGGAQFLGEKLMS
nr:hypothetical protein [Tanacetum cinerariifolium]